MSKGEASSDSKTRFSFLPVRTWDNFGQLTAQGSINVSKSEASSDNKTRFSFLPVRTWNNFGQATALGAILCPKAKLLRTTRPLFPLNQSEHKATFAKSNPPHFPGNTTKKIPKRKKRKTEVSLF